MRNTRSTFSILFYINRSKAKKSGKCPILGRISIDGENTAFSTGLDILSADWNVNLGKATNDNSINRKLQRFRNEVEKHYRTMLETKGFVTAEMLKNALRGIGTQQNTLMQEFEVFLEEKKRSISIRISESTYALYHLGYRQLQKYLRNKLKINDIPFGKVDIAFIEDYQLLILLLSIIPSVKVLTLFPLLHLQKAQVFLQMDRLREMQFCLQVLLGVKPLQIYYLEFLEVWQQYF